MSRAWWSFSMTSRDLSTKNVSLLPRLWIPNSAVMFCSNCMKMWGDEKKLGYFTITTPHSHCVQHLAVFSLEQYGCHSHPLCSLDLAPCGFFLFSELKMKKGVIFTVLWFLTTSSKQTSREHSISERSTGASVPVHKVTTSRKMVASKSYGEFWLIYRASPEISYHTLYIKIS